MNSPNGGRRVTRIDELERDIPPARDLWPAIQAAIEADQAGAAAPRAPRRSAWRPAVGLAASVALVAIGVLIGRGMAPTGTPPATTMAAATPIGQELRWVPAALQDDAEYRRQRDAVLVDVRARLSAMQPAERDKVMASLLTLQRSIAEIEAALGRDPANALLQELLVNSCQEEMRALTAVRDAGRQEI